LRIKEQETRLTLQEHDDDDDDDDDENGRFYKQDRQCRCNVTLRRVRVTIVAMQKAISIIYSECVCVVLVIQHAKRMRHVILSLCPVRLFHIFPHYLLNGMIFEKKKKLQFTKCGF